MHLRLHSHALQHLRQPTKSHNRRDARPRHPRLQPGEELDKDSGAATRAHLQRPNKSLRLAPWRRAELRHWRLEHITRQQGRHGSRSNPRRPDQLHGRCIRQRAAHGRPVLSRANCRGTAECAALWANRLRPRYLRCEPRGSAASSRRSGAHLGPEKLGRV